MSESIPQGFKRCSKCGEVKSLDCFSKRPNRKCGVMSQCKACRSEQKRQERINNPEKLRHLQRMRYERNIDKIKESAKRYRMENPEKVKRHRHEYYLNNLEYIRKQSSSWSKENREKAKERGHRYRARKRRAKVRVRFDAEAILFDVQNGYCLYCQCELLNGYHLDHIIPLVLVDLLGEHYPGHVPSNLCLACSDCNLSKHHSILEDWLAWKYPDQMDEILHRVEQHIAIMKEWEK